MLAADGVEPVVGDPDRVVTIAPALERVGVLCVLLASAIGPDAALAALHGPRLEMLLGRTVDSTVRGVVYECRGSVDPRLLQRGAETVRAICEQSRIPYALLDADPDRHKEWLVAAVHAVDRIQRPALS